MHKSTYSELYEITLDIENLMRAVGQLTNHEVESDQLLWWEGKMEHVRAIFWLSFEKTEEKNEKKFLIFLFSFL